MAFKTSGTRTLSAHPPRHRGTASPGSAKSGSFPPAARIPLEEYSFACVDEGKGEPLVFIHGSLGTFLDFAPAVRHFAPRYRAVTYSRRFHPPNAVEDSDREYTVARHADDLEALMDQLRIESAHVIGSSWGAYVALFLAIRSPALVRTLVLGEPPVFPLLRRSPVGRDLLDNFRRETILPSLEGLHRADGVDGVRIFVDGVTGRPGHFDSLPGRARRLLLLSAEELRREFETPPTGYMPDLTGESLNALTCPVLLLEGERSPKLFHLITDELELAIPGTVRETVPGTGHAIHAGNPEGYFRRVGHFLGRQQKGPKRRIS